MDYSYGVGLLRPFAQDYRVSSPSGMRTKPNAGASSFHKGTDFATPVGTPLLASLSGNVVRAATQQGGGGWGHYTAICDPNTGVCAQYSHLSEIGVKPGQFVKAGDIIGKSGKSGNVTGPHLDYMVTRNGKLLGMDGKEFGDSGFSWLSTPSTNAQPTKATPTINNAIPLNHYSPIQAGGGTIATPKDSDQVAFLQQILKAPDQTTVPISNSIAQIPTPTYYLQKWFTKPL